MRQTMTEGKAAHWTDAKERGHYWAMRGLVTLYRVSGRALAYPIVTVVVFYFFLTRSSTRRHSAQYLRRVFGRPASLWQVWRHHLTFGRSLMDRISAWMGRFERTDVAFAGHQTLLELQEQRRGAVLLGAHFGNLELCRAVIENDGSLTLNVILHSRNTENFNRVLRSVSDQVQVRLIQVDEVTPATAIMLRERLDRGEFLVLLADRLPPDNQERTLAADFLGDPVQLPAGPFWLALMLGAPVYFLAGYQTENGYEAALEPLYPGGKVARRERDSVCRELVRLYTRTLENCCRRYPFQWFNFFDFWGDDQPRGEPPSSAPSSRSTTDS